MTKASNALVVDAVAVSSTSTDQQLVRRCIAGEPEALRRMCDENAKAVRRVVRLLGPRSVPSQDDLVQDTFLRALEALPRYRGQASLGVWLRGIALNIARTQRDRESRRRRLLGSIDVDQPEEGVAPDAHVEGRAALQRLWILLDRLPADEREAFVFRNIERLSVREVASLTRSPESTVSDRAKRAHRKLSDWMKEDV